MNGLPLYDVLLVILGGLFGWLLGKLPAHWVYGVMATAIVLLLVVLAQR